MYKIKELVFISTILIICVTIFSGCEYLEKLERMEGEKKTHSCTRRRKETAERSDGKTRISESSIRKLS